jgi:hypothetical protein
LEPQALRSGATIYCAKLQLLLSACPPLYNKRANMTYEELFGLAGSGACHSLSGAVLSIATPSIVSRRMSAVLIP